MNQRKRSRPASMIPLGICLACFGTLAAAIVFFGIRYQGMTRLDPDPDLPADVSEEGFPRVDWDYWKQVNPHVIGWITIPDTPVDYPIVQAQEDDPGYYLDHDVFGNWNYMGCPYLDAECAGLGLEASPNAVVFAHNLGYGDMSLFASVACYADTGFAEGHRVILAQTPAAQMAFRAQGAAVIHGSTDSKRTSFDGKQDLWDWIGGRYEECQVLLEPTEQRPERVLTLCTCSYRRWENERTLLYATPMQLKEL